MIGFCQIFLFLRYVCLFLFINALAEKHKPTNNYYVHLSSTSIVPAAHDVVMFHALQSISLSSCRMRDPISSEDFSHPFLKTTKVKAGLLYPLKITNPLSLFRCWLACPRPGSWGKLLATAAGSHSNIVLLLKNWHNSPHFYENIIYRTF